MKGPRRRRLAVEVIQSSAMDCGPAVLQCMCAGHGLRVSYGRLREACQTDLDGTSIDTLEEVAVALGLEAEQLLAPVDHLFLQEAAALPAIAVVRQPGGMTHFVVVWSYVAGWVQIMDPSSGRRFVRADAFTRRLFVHQMSVPADAVREWLGSDEFLGPLRRRAAALRVPGHRIDGWIAAAAAESHILPLARIDAAVRLATTLVDVHALARGDEVTRCVEQLLHDSDGLTGAALHAVLPEQCFTAIPGPDEHTALLRGAVLVRARGVRPDAPALPGQDLSQSTLSPDLVAAVQAPQISPLRQMFGLLRAEGVVWPALLIVGLAVAAATVIVEALVLRATIDVGASLGVGEQRLAAVAVILLFFAAQALLELPLALGVRRLGRRLSARLRIAFLTQIPRLGDRYLASRPISDMAERCHRGHVLRDLPDVAARLLRRGFEMVFTTGALIWLDPAGAPWIVLAAVTVVALPLAALPSVFERTARLGGHTGALGQFYLDALLGLVAIRTHAAERALLREHEGQLVEWSHAQRDLFRVVVVVAGLGAFVGLGLAAVLFIDHVGRHAEPVGALLLLYWALSLPMLGERIADTAFEIPALRVAALRLLEPLHTTPEADPATAAATPLADGGVALTLRAVRVVAGGHTILHDIDLEVTAGQHLAVVGPSGAGKSTLVGLLLGWHRAGGGEIFVDGRPLDEPALVALRQVTAWVDPGVQLWNDSLLANLHYGNVEAHHALTDTLDRADLIAVLERLPDGLQTALGEGGGLVSGGEGQRVRLGRALLRERPRLVLLDEPFRGLDRGTREALLARARAHWRGCTLICVTHDIDAVGEFDRVLVMAGGRIVEDADPRVSSREASSQLAALLRSEETLRRDGWSDPRWRRMNLVDGTLHMQAEVDP